MQDVLHPVESDKPTTGTLRAELDEEPDTAPAAEATHCSRRLPNTD